MHHHVQLYREIWRQAKPIVDQGAGRTRAKRAQWAKRARAPSGERHGEGPRLGDRWKRMLEKGEFSTAKELAVQEGSTRPTSDECCD